MTKMQIDLDIQNQKELLRVCENNLKKAKDEKEKEEMNKSIVKINTEIAKLKEEEKTAK